MLYHRYHDIVILTQKSLYFLHNGYMSSCEKKLNGYVNLKRTVGYQSTKIEKFACYILACLSSCLITEWLQLPHEVTSSCHRVIVYCTVSCFAGSVFTSMESAQLGRHKTLKDFFFALIQIWRLPEWPRSLLGKPWMCIVCWRS